MQTVLAFVFISLFAVGVYGQDLPVETLEVDLLQNLMSNDTSGNASAENVTVSCADQMEAQFMCESDLKESDEVKLIWDRKIQVLFSTCAPEYPESCIQEIDAAHLCSVDIKHRFMEDEELQAMWNETKTKIDQCFNDNPTNPLDGLEELLMPPMMKMGGHDKMGPPKHKSGKCAKSSEEKKKNSGEKKGNDTETEKKESRRRRRNADKSSEEKKEKEMEMPAIEIRKECMKTPEQMECMVKELSTLAMNDTEFSSAIERLLQRDLECKSKISRQCMHNTPKLMKCVMEAFAPKIHILLMAMKTCMAARGFDPDGNVTSSSEGNGTLSSDTDANITLSSEGGPEGTTPSADMGGNGTLVSEGNVVLSSGTNTTLSFEGTPEGTTAPPDMGGTESAHGNSTVIELHMSADNGTAPVEAVPMFPPMPLDLETTHAPGKDENNVKKTE